MARGSKGGTKLDHHTRRRLSEEGRRLLRHAFSEEDTTTTEQTSVDYSVVTNRDDASAVSDLDSYVEYEQQMAQQKRSKRRNGKTVNEEDDENGDLDKAIKELGEKRDETKICALNKIIGILSESVLTDKIGSNRETLSSSILGCLKKRMADSGPLSLRALAALAITLGPEEQQYYDDIVISVQRVLTDDCEAALRVEAAYALSIACFVCTTDDQHTWEVIETIGNLLVASRDAEDDEDHFPEEFVVALFQSWAFLISAFDPSSVVPKIYDSNSILYEHVQALSSFVREGVNPTVRASACEVLALLVQYKYILEKGSWTYAQEDADSPIGGLDTKIESYMKETGKNIGKKNRKTQRSMLKEVIETLESGEGPVYDLHIEEDTLSISSWSRYFQALVFRRALLTGFQVHLTDNELLRNVFEVSDRTNSKMSMVRRRANNKARSVGRRNQINRKDHAQNAFLYGDESK